MAAHSKLVLAEKPDPKSVLLQYSYNSFNLFPPFLMVPIARMADIGQETWQPCVSGADANDSWGSSTGVQHIWLFSFE